MISKKKPLFSISLLFFYLIVFVLLIFTIDYFSEVRNGLKLFEQIRPDWLLIALFAQAGTYFFNAGVYQVLLKAYTRKKIFTIKELFQASIAMLFFNQAVPSAGLSGNAFFSQLLLKKGVAIKKTISLMALVLIVSYATMVIIIALLFIIGAFSNVPRFFFSLLAIGFLVFSLLGALSSIIGRKKTIDYLIKKISRIKLFKNNAQKYQSIFESRLSKNENPLRIFLARRATSGEAIACKIGIVACDALTIYALFIGFGVTINPIAPVFALILTEIIALVPVAPGALVLYEGSMIFFLTQMGAPIGVTVTVVLLYRILSFWLPVPLGLFFYKNLQKNT